MRRSEIRRDQDAYLPPANELVGDINHPVYIHAHRSSGPIRPMRYVANHVQIRDESHRYTGAKDALNHIYLSKMQYKIPRFNSLKLKNYVDLIMNNYLACWF
jgi:hypothetical protein